MNHKTLSIVLVLVIGCAPYQGVTNIDSPHQTIVCFGDSLTQGEGALPGQDYPSHLARLLGRPVINAGRSGETAALGLLRIGEDVLPHYPVLVLVEFGGNDALRGIPATEFEHALMNMVERIQGAGAMVVLAGIPSGPLMAQGYDAVYRRVAKRRGAVLIPNILTGLLTDPHLRSDTIHPNDAGYVRMAETVFRAVHPLLVENAKRRRKR